MVTRITLASLLVLTGSLTACAGGDSADAANRAVASDLATARAGATENESLNPTDADALAWRVAFERAAQLQDLPPPAERDDDRLRQAATADRDLATVLALYQDLLAAQAEYQGDQSRWRAEDNYARAKGSTNAAMGVRTPTPRRPDPRLKVAVTRAREAFDAEYGRLSAENKQRCDAQISALVEGNRASRGPRSR